MKKFFITLKELFRRDNVKTWIPLIGSFAGLFLSPALDLVIKDSPYNLLCSFLVGTVCGTIYLCLTFKYIRQIHSIYTVLRSDETLWRTCAYLANRQEWENTNNHKVEKLKINYMLENSVTNSAGIRTYPFVVEYEVDCRAVAPMTEIYYRTVGETYKAPHVKVEYAFGNREYSLVDSSNYDGNKKSITFYKLYTDTCYGTGQPFKYKIRVSYDAERGIAANRKQGIIFDSANFLSQTCGNVRATVKLYCPASTETDFDKIHIRQYIDGLNTIPNESQTGMRKIGSVDSQIEYRCSPIVEYNRLYVLMFVAKKQQ